MARPRIIVIVGPTASGKTTLAVSLAKKFNGEIVSADSRQVYKHMDIGTGKATAQEMTGVPHYGINIADPRKTFTVEQFRKVALDSIETIYKKGKIPILVGGTGFYVDAVLYGSRYPQIPPDWQLRAKLEKKTTEELYILLTSFDPTRAASIDKNNRRRLIRAIEIIKKAGWIPPVSSKSHFDALVIGIKKDHAELRDLIHKRLEDWIKRGFIREVEDLNKKYDVTWKRIGELGLNYREIADFLQKKISREKAIVKADMAIWHYAKRQLTWFRRMKSVHWIISTKEAEKLVKDFLQ